MERRKYKTETISFRNVRLLDLHLVKQRGGIVNITFERRKRIRVRKPITPGELTFHDKGNTIVWEEDSLCCSPATFMLVFYLWRAPNRFLSKEEMRENVVQDDDASDLVLRGRIKQARQELRDGDFPYKIITERGKGYRLTSRFEPENEL